ncbi:hypothetical protein H6P81_006979 [Aristolochia fimbriata]|uniref:RING-type domain-containing protein n=1 Tax=Aristolochia fimbriata TaxID=158543 RepID=A0AAV7F107_ARIFI|nr:hypothetical protein H6P81_006979 [Aristolochia fimbriata]
MIALGSRFVSPGNANEGRGERSCRALHFDAYGSKHRATGSSSLRVNFQFRKVEKWENTTTVAAAAAASGGAADQEGRVVSHFSTNDMVHGPQNFWFDMEMVNSRDRLPVCVDAMLSETDYFEETKAIVRCEMPSFVPVMVGAALEMGCWRLDIVVRAEEVVRFIYNDDEEEDDDDDEYDEEEEEEGQYEGEENAVEGLGEMRPAASGSIESLKTTKVADLKDVVDENMVCVVCLNKLFVIDGEVAQLPCSHMFHKQCVVEWLERSHVCPVCRFELPV